MKKTILIMAVLIFLCTTVYALENNFYGKSSDGVVARGWYKNGGWLEEDYLTVKIKNDSKNPIEFNPLVDEYLVISKDDTTYKCIIPNGSYPELLNPNEVRDRISVNARNISLQPKDVKYIKIILNYGKTLIELEPK